MRLVEVAIFLVAWIVLHGLVHGLLDLTWTGTQVLILTLAVGWLAIRYYRHWRARLRRRLTAR
jgi:hypothetical protein